MVKLPLSFFPGELKLPILKLAATEIVSGISGESESRLRELFDKAVASAPCILFIDEIDAITQRRDQTNKGETRPTKVPRKMKIDCSSLDSENV